MRILIVYDSNITDCDCPVRKQLGSFFGDARSGGDDSVFNGAAFSRAWPEI